MSPEEIKNLLENLKLCQNDFENRYLIAQQSPKEEIIAMFDVFIDYFNENIDEVIEELE